MVQCYCNRYTVTVYTPTAEDSKLQDRRSNFDTATKAHN